MNDKERVEQVTRLLLGVCGRCKAGQAQTPHICPYAQDINNDSETLCDCCEGCSQDCADDI